MVKILVFGDSITWGAFDYESAGWVERLKKYYFKSFDELGVSVYNFGISSDDTNGILLRLENQIKYINKIEPEEFILLFSIGSNDARFFGIKEEKKIPTIEFANNLNKIIKISKKYSNQIVFTGLLQVDENKTRPVPWIENEFYENDDLKQYNDIIEKTCKNNNIDFIPLWDAINKNNLEDGVHPNSIGHQKIYELIKNYLDKITLN